MQTAPSVTTLTRLAGLAGAAALVALAAATVAPPVHTVEQLDLQRYAGLWYELARVPNRMQALCVADVTATYRPLDDGSLRLIQRCREADGRWGVAVGRAVAVQGDPSGARLKVNYLPAWLRWWPGARDDHWVVMLGDDYRYAVVSDPSRDSLWILSRTPSLDAETLEAILARLRSQKYPVDHLIPTHQHAAAGGTSPMAVQRPRLMV